MIISQYGNPLWAITITEWQRILNRDPQNWWLIIISPIQIANFQRPWLIMRGSTPMIQTCRGLEHWVKFWVKSSTHFNINKITTYLQISTGSLGKDGVRVLWPLWRAVLVPRVKWSIEKADRCQILHSGNCWPSLRAVGKRQLLLSNLLGVRSSKRDPERSR